MNPLALLRTTIDGDLRYESLSLWCPGCERMDENDRKYGGLHMLPVRGETGQHPRWDWNGDLVNVTLEPSILTRYSGAEGEFVCHSFLRNGQWQFLGDCTHALANQTVAMVPLPDWVVR